MSPLLGLTLGLRALMELGIVAALGYWAIRPGAVPLPQALSRARARIMEAYGFHFLAMGETQTERRTEFVCLLEWPDEATMRAVWTNFMAEEEWKEIKRLSSAQHGDLVGEIEDRVLIATDNSPGWLSGSVR